MSAFKTCLQKTLLNPYLNFQQVRYYPRWSHRRPVRVYEPEEYETLQKGGKVQQKREETIDKFTPKIENSNFETVERVAKTTARLAENVEEVEQKEFDDFGFERIKEPKRVMLRRPVHKKEVPKVDMFETVIDVDGNLVYSKMQNKDSRITSLFVNLKSRKSKESILLEGKRLIKEALLAGCKLQYVLFSRKNDIEELKQYLPKTGAKLYKLPYQEMQAWSELTTTPGVMAIFKIPDLTKIAKNSTALPLTVICDNIREPGNLGAVLRTSAGLGCENVILSKGCADLWNFKVLRSACGAHFKIPIEHKVDWTEIGNKIQDSTVFIADNNTNKSSVEIPVFPYIEINYKMCKKVTLIVGGETEGISNESYKLATEFNGCRINIPLINDVDSLNTGSALGIIAFEIRRQFLEQDFNDVEENSVQ